MPDRPLPPGFITALNDIDRRLRDTERQIVLPDEGGDDDLQVSENGSPLGPVTRLDFGPGISAALLGDRFVQVSGGSRSYATFVVAASDTSPQGKDSADFVCTGVNDQDTIMEALAALPIIDAPNDFPSNTFQRGKVLLLEGTYHTSSEILMSGLYDVTLSGIGPGTVLVPTGSPGSGSCIALYACDGVVIENMKMEGNNFGGDLSDYVLLNLDSVKCVLRGLVMYGGGFVDGIVLAGRSHRVLDCTTSVASVGYRVMQDNGLGGAVGCSLVNCTAIAGSGYVMRGMDNQAVGCSAAYSDGPGFSVGGDATDQRNLVSGCTVYEFGQDVGSNQTGIRLLHGSGHTVTGCTITTTQGTGSERCITVSSDTIGCVVSANSVDGQGAVAIGIEVGGTDHTITSNTVEDMEDYGISVVGSRIHVEGNRVGNCDEHGIRMSGGDDCAILDNYIYANSAATNNTFDGIFITTGADRTNVQGNTIRVGGGANNHRYAINIATADCDETLVCNNDTLTGFVTAAVNNAGTTTRLCSSTGGPGLAGHIIEDEAVVLAQRGTMNFVGAGVTATDAGGKTVVTIPATATINGHVIEDEGTPLTQRANLNFVGAGVTVTDSAPDTVVTIPGGGHVIEDEGVAMPAQPNLNFVGAGVTVTDSGPDTIVTIPGGGGGGGDEPSAADWMSF